MLRLLGLLVRLLMGVFGFGDDGEPDYQELQPLGLSVIEPVTPLT